MGSGACDCGLEVVKFKIETSNKLPFSAFSFMVPNTSVFCYLGFFFSFFWILKMSCTYSRPWLKFQLINIKLLNIAEKTKHQVVWFERVLKIIIRGCGGDNFELLVLVLLQVENVLERKAGYVGPTISCFCSAFFSTLFVSSLASWRNL